MYTADTINVTFSLETVVDRTFYNLLNSAFRKLISVTWSGFPEVDPHVYFYPLKIFLSINVRDGRFS